MEVIRLVEEPVSKTGGEHISLVSSSLTASAFVNDWSRGPVATTPGLHPENDGLTPSGIIPLPRLDTPIGRATQLKIEWL